MILPSRANERKSRLLCKATIRTIVIIVFSHGLGSTVSTSIWAQEWQFVDESAVRLPDTISLSESVAGGASLS
jgi:hypothetical protein